MAAMVSAEFSSMMSVLVMVSDRYGMHGSQGGAAGMGRGVATGSGAGAG